MNGIIIKEEPVDWEDESLQAECDMMMSEIHNDVMIKEEPTDSSYYVPLKYQETIKSEVLDDDVFKALFFPDELENDCHMSITSSGRSDSERGKKKAKRKGTKRNLRRIHTEVAQESLAPCVALVRLENSKDHEVMRYFESALRSTMECSGLHNGEFQKIIQFANQTVGSEDFRKGNIGTYCTSLWESDIGRRKRRKRNSHKNQTRTYHSSHVFDQYGSPKSSIIEGFEYEDKKLNGLQCDLCQKWFSTMGDLIAHIGNHFYRKEYECSVCRKTFKWSYSLSVHMSKHSREKAYTCHICGLKYKSRKPLKRHDLTHTGKMPHVCNICRKVFICSWALRRHVEAHTAESTEKCSICERQFASKLTLKQHMSTHTPENLYECDQCQKTFTNKNNLKFHTYIHTGKKPYKCNVCTKSFTCYSTWRSHCLVHSGEKPHKCSYCGRGFARKLTLRRHVLTHTGERPYACNICQRTFTRTTLLKLHVKLDHGN